MRCFSNVAVIVTVNNSTLYAPMVELPAAENARFLKALSSGNFKRALIWRKFIKQDSPGEIDRNTKSSIEVEPGLDAVLKLYVIHRENFNFDQTTVDLHSTITPKNINIVIDSEDFNSEDINNDEEAYKLIAENFNMGGKDLNTGALLDFRMFKNQNNFYVFDLSRQKVLEGNPRKCQSIQFRCKPSTECHLKFFVAHEKTRAIDFAKPENTKTRWWMDVGRKKLLSR